MYVINNMQDEKDFNSWSEEDNKKAHYNARARHLISLTLTMEEFFKLSTCKNTKKMWETLGKA